MVCMGTAHACNRDCLISDRVCLIPDRDCLIYDRDCLVYDRDCLISDRDCFICAGYETGRGADSMHGDGARVQVVDFRAPSRKVSPSNGTSWRVPCRGSVLLKAAPLDERVSLTLNPEAQTGRGVDSMHGHGARLQVRGDNASRSRRRFLERGVHDRAHAGLGERAGRETRVPQRRLQVSSPEPNTLNHHP